MGLPAFHKVLQQRPVGLLDSGVGGLSVLREVKKLLPEERLVYVADSGFGPYGNRSTREISDRVFRLTEHLMAQDIKTLVLACNTATAVAIDELRSAFAIPIIGMEPAVKPAVAMSRSGMVGIMATDSTLSSRRVQALIERFGAKANVILQPCSKLVAQIERNPFNCGVTESMVREYVTPLVAAGVDTIVLGCTHFPIIKSLIREIAGASVRIIDTGVPVARLLKRRLQEESLLASLQGDKDLLITSGDEYLLRKFIPYCGLRKYQIQTIS